jgi:class 3 adenylate cyclase
MGETRKIAAILVSDVVGYSRLAGADEERTLARLRALRSDLIDPTISVHHGRIVKRTGDGSIIEFRSVVDAVRCALEVQHAMGGIFLRPRAIDARQGAFFCFAPGGKTDCLHPLHDRGRRPLC